MKIPSLRLFFALWPDPDAQRALAGLLGSLAAPEAQHPEDLHITLAFLGQVSTAILPCLEQIAASLDPGLFRLRLDQMGYWPTPRILWCGPSASPPALLDLAKDLQEGLAACGITPERRRYQPHVTLLRLANGLPNPLPAVDIPWIVREFVLAETLSGATPHYRILKRWPLGSSP
ncbi:RNA 2',3'-cyclic phosphodiesterase [Gammaproteobacteria bacterium]